MSVILYPQQKKRMLMKTLGGKTWLLSPLSDTLFAIQGQLIEKSINGRKNVLLVKSRTHKYFRRELRNGKWRYFYYDNKGNISVEVSDNQKRVKSDKKTNTSAKLQDYQKKMETDNKIKNSRTSKKLQNVKKEHNDLIKSNSEGFSDFKKKVINVFKGKDIFVGRNLKNLNATAMLASVEGSAVVFKNFPQLKKIFKGFNITTHEDVIMGCRPDDQFNGTIIFHYCYISYVEALETINQSETVGSKIVLQSKLKLAIRSMGIHEAGHLLEMLLIRLNPKYKYKKEREIAWRNCTEAEIIIKRALSSKEFKGEDSKELMRKISDYATSSYSECLAEAVVYVYSKYGQIAKLSNGQAAKLSSRIVKELEKRLKELNSLNKLNKLTKSLMRRIRNVFR